MNDKNLDVSNKKNAGKGNGNSVINNKSTSNTTKDYVSGEFPTSTAHKFSSKNQNEDVDVDRR